MRVRPELISLVRIIPVEERQRRHHLAASGLRPRQEKRQQNIADKRAAKKVSVTAEPKQELPKAGSNPRADKAGPVDSDVEMASGSY